MQNRVAVSELKAKLAAYLRAVRTQGQELIITDHDVPVARIMPLEVNFQPPKPMLNIIPPAPGAQRFEDVKLSSARIEGIDIVAELREDRDRR